MQDRRRQFDEIFLQRTAGPYIWVNRYPLLLAGPGMKSAMARKLT